MAAASVLSFVTYGHGKIGGTNPRQRPRIYPGATPPAKSAPSIRRGAVLVRPREQAYIRRMCKPAEKAPWS